MTQDEQYHRENLHLTFSQRVGAVPLPDLVRPEHLSMPFRIDLAYLFREEIKKVTRRTDGDYYHSDKTHVGIMLWHYKMKVLNEFPHDIPDPIPARDYAFIANLLENGQYHEILTLCEWFLGNAYHLQEMCDGIVAAFDNNPSAYKIGYAGYTPFIYPVNQASAESVGKALYRLNSNNQTDILSKISEAATQLNNQAYIASAKFGMDAVEISGSQLAPNKNSLGKVLSEIAKQKLLPNNEIKQILDKINAYANEHARHAKEDTPRIERDEAIYFFGLCAVTADYLASKQQPN